VGVVSPVCLFHQNPSCIPEPVWVHNILFVGLKGDHLFPAKWAVTPCLCPLTPGAAFIGESSRGSLRSLFEKFIRREKTFLCRLCPPSFLLSSLVRAGSGTWGRRAGRRLRGGHRPRNSQALPFGCSWATGSQLGLIGCVWLHVAGQLVYAGLLWPRCLVWVPVLSWSLGPQTADRGVYHEWPASEGPESSFDQSAPEGASCLISCWFGCLVSVWVQFTGMILCYNCQVGVTSVLDLWWHPIDTGQFQHTGERQRDHLLQPLPLFHPLHTLHLHPHPNSTWRQNEVMAQRCPAPRAPCLNENSWLPPPLEKLPPPLLPS
jgi:hypothetical protein